MILTTKEVRQVVEDYKKDGFSVEADFDDAMTVKATHPEDGSTVLLILEKDPGVWLVLRG